MTDGIIQEVFKPVKEKLKMYFNTDNDLDLVPLKAIEMLEQELIEKIKQANTKNPDWDSNFAIGVKLMKIYLIGDNQE